MATYVLLSTLTDEGRKTVRIDLRESKRLAEKLKLGVPRLLHNMRYLELMIL